MTAQSFRLFVNEGRALYAGGGQRHRVQLACDQRAEAKVDTLSKHERSKRMGLIQSRDTKPEMVVRRLIHRLGYRYRLHCSDLPGKPDLVFRSRSKVILVHGCFWHMHNGCRNCRMPKSNIDFWRRKLESNRKRDIRNKSALSRMGWNYLVVWECQIKRTALYSIVDILRCRDTS